jgi:hypothetical protein
MVSVEHSPADPCLNTGGAIFMISYSSYSSTNYRYGSDNRRALKLLSDRKLLETAYRELLTLRERVRQAEERVAKAQALPQSRLKP